MITKKHTPRPGRPPLERDRLEKMIRKQIRQGHWAPDSQIPTREELIERYGVSSRTLQDAIHQLRGDGYLVSQGRKGTFVTSKPPHRHRIGLVFMNSFKGSDPVWGAFQQSLLLASRRIPTVEWVPYLDSVSWRPGHPELTRFEMDIRKERIGGVVFVETPLYTLGAGFLPTGKCPAVCLTDYGDPLEWFRVLCPEYDLLLHMMMQQAVTLGARKIALWEILVANKDEDSLHEYQVTAEEFGLELDPWLLHSLPPFGQVEIKHLLDLMMRLPAAKRPEALLLIDDNLLKATLEAAEDLGLKLGRDLNLITHLNSPNHLSDIPPGVHPVCFSTRKALEQAAAWILNPGSGGFGREKIPYELLTLNSVGSS